jgi:hypothetical protein
MFGIDWNPLHLLKSLLKDATAPLSPIQKWVIKQLVRAGGLIENDIAKLARAVHSHLGGVENTLSFLAGQINNLAADAGKDVGVSISWLTSEVNTLVSDAVGSTVKGLGWLTNEIDNLETTVDPWISKALSTFARDVITPLSDEVKALDPSLYNGMANDWDHFKKYDLPTLRHDVHDAETGVGSALHWIDHEGHDIKVLLDGCWDWLVYLGKLSVEEAEHLPEQLKARLPSELTVASMKPDKALWDRMIAELREEIPSA